MFFFQNFQDVMKMQACYLLTSSELKIYHNNRMKPFTRIISVTNPYNFIDICPTHEKRYSFDV